jgi:hypothetical protein
MARDSAIEAKIPEKPHPSDIETAPERHLPFARSESEEKNRT